MAVEDQTILLLSVWTLMAQCTKVSYLPSLRVIIVYNHHRESTVTYEMPELNLFELTFLAQTLFNVLLQI